MPVLSLACHLPHNTPNIPSRYNNEQTTKQTKAINNSYIYISHVNVTQTVPDISPLMPMHQDPLLVAPVFTWWRHQMETFSALLALCAGNSPITGEFPSQRPVTRSFDVFFDLCLYKRLSKQFRGWWFETPSGSLWRHCNDTLATPHKLVGNATKMYAMCSLAFFVWNFK